MRRDLLALALLATASAAAADGNLVIRAGSAFTGERFLVPAEIVIEGGRVVSVGPPGATRSPAPVLELPHLTALPGLVDARSGAGLPPQPNEEGSEITPALDALELVDPASPDMERALRAGVTTVVVSPGGRGVIPGTAAALKTDPRRLEDRVVARRAALCLTLGIEPAIGNRVARFQQPQGLYFRRPGNRMGVVAEVRRAFAKAAAADPAGDAGDAILDDARVGRLPVLVRARTESDLRAALRLARELGLRATLVDAVEAHRLVEPIAAAGTPVLLGPLYQLPRTPLESWEGEDLRQATASILHDGGVPVAIGTGPDEDPAGLRDSASLAARHGLPAEAALAAITAVPARLLGISHRVGRLEPGRDGDVVLIEGDPLDPAAPVRMVVVEGRVVIGGDAAPRQAFRGTVR